MELEELKHIWKVHTETTLAEQQVEAADIRRMIHARSRSAWRGIKRNILWEVALLLVLFVLICAIVWFEQISLSAGRWGLIGGAFVTGLAFYAIKYRLLNRPPLTTGNLHDTLRHLTSVMRTYIRIYQAIVFLLIPLFGGLFFLLGVREGTLLQGGSLSAITPFQWLLIAGTICLYMLLMIWGGRWYIRQLYGNHYETLQTCLQELEEQEVDS